MTRSGQCDFCQFSAAKLAFWRHSGTGNTQIYIYIYPITRLAGSLRRTTEALLLVGVIFLKANVLALQQPVKGAEELTPTEKNLTSEVDMKPLVE